MFFLIEWGLQYQEKERSMIQKDTYQQVLFDCIKRGSTIIADDVLDAFKMAIEQETGESAKAGLTHTLESINMARVRENPACPDTGWPLFFFKVGNSCEIEGGFTALEEAARYAVRKATKEGYLRATMKHPLTGEDPGDNVGNNIPHFTYRFVEGDDLQIIFAAKGGGSECFGGTRHRVIAFADGIKGIEKFIIEAFIEASRAGAICSPNILGIGIGGTADVAADLAKQAASLRPIGSHNPEMQFRKMEEDLYRAINSLGVGCMGVGGNTSVFAVHVEYAYTHLAGICVAISSNCMVARRAASRIKADNTIIELKNPEWFEGGN